MQSAGRQMGSRQMGSRQMGSRQMGSRQVGHGLERLRRRLADSWKLVAESFFERTKRECLWKQRMRSRSPRVRSWELDWPTDWATFCAYHLFS